MSKKDEAHGVELKEHDPVNKPRHYTDGKIEVIDFIEDKKLGFHLGNAVKYIARAGKKDPDKTIQDLEKAQWYIKRHIENLKASPISGIIKHYEETKEMAGCASLIFPAAVMLGVILLYCLI